MGSAGKAIFQAGGYFKGAVGKSQKHCHVKREALYIAGFPGILSRKLNSVLYAMILHYGIKGF